MSSSSDIAVNSPTPQAYVLGAGQGEHLIHFRDGGDIFIKADPLTGSRHLGLGTQQLAKGSGIPVHRHLQSDEVFYVLEGRGAVTLNDLRHPCERGATIFIPRNTWHGFSSPDQGWSCCGSWCPLTSRASSGQPAAGRASRARN